MSRPAWHSSGVLWLLLGTCSEALRPTFQPSASRGAPQPVPPVANWAHRSICGCCFGTLPAGSEQLRVLLCKHVCGLSLCRAHDHGS